MLTIRLARAGAKKRPFFHITVADSRKPRDGRFVERVGYFNPISSGKEVRLEINQERVEYWLSQGAQVSDKVSALLKEKNETPEEKERRARVKEKRRLRKLAKRADTKTSLEPDKSASEAPAEAAEETPAEEAPAEAAEETPAEEAPAEAVEESETDEDNKALDNSDSEAADTSSEENPDK